MKTDVTLNALQAGPHGTHNAAIQSAIDAAGRQGGGTVRLEAGEYLLEDSLRLRSNVALIGAGDGTRLRCIPERASALAADLGYGHYDITLAEPEEFRVGMGVIIHDDRAGGFYDTAATLTWRDGATFGISRMLNHDYGRAYNGAVYTSFPPVCAAAISGALLADLVIDGSGPEGRRIANGCRGGGVFLIGAEHVTLRRLTVCEVFGEGVSFQQCRHVLIEDCRLLRNAGNGLHPGSGSVGAVMRRCRCEDNGAGGIFFCLRAAYSLVEDCALIANRQDGITIGQRDTHNAVRGCAIRDNGAAGITLRACDRVMAAHATRIEDNVFANNGRTAPAADMLVESPAQQVYIARNRFLRDAHLPPSAAVRITADGAQVALQANTADGNFVEAAIPEGVGATEPPAAGPEAMPPNADRHLGCASADGQPGAYSGR